MEALDSASLVSHGKLSVLDLLSCIYIKVLPGVIVCSLVQPVRLLTKQYYLKHGSKREAQTEIKAKRTKRGEGWQKYGAYFKKQYSISVPGK